MLYNGVILPLSEFYLVFFTSFTKHYTLPAKNNILTFSAVRQFFLFLPHKGWTVFARITFRIQQQNGQAFSEKKTICFLILQPTQVLYTSYTTQEEHQTLHPTFNPDQHLP